MNVVQIIHYRVTSCPDLPEAEATHQSTPHPPTPTPKMEEKITLPSKPESRSIVVSLECIANSGF